MNKILFLALFLAFLQPVFLNDAQDADAASEGSESSPADDEADPPAADGDADANDDAEASNRFWWRDHYGSGYHRHYGYYGCCDMNYWGRTKCCYYRPWSACCGGKAYYSGHGHGYNHGHYYYNGHGHHDHKKTLVLKTEHSHFDSPILRSSKSTVYVGGHD